MSRPVEAWRVLARICALAAVTIGCTARPKIGPPPVLPGIAAVPGATGCMLVEASSHALWSVVWKQAPFGFGHSAITIYQLIKIDLVSGDIVARVDLSPGHGGVSGLAVGAGAVWVAAGEHSRLYKVDPAQAELLGEAEIRTRLLRRTLVRIATADDRVWVVSGSRLIGVDPETLETTSTVELHADGLDVAFAHGAVWVLHANGVSRVDSVTHRVLGVVPGPKLRSVDGFDSFVGEAPGALWYARETSKGRRLFRVDVRANRIEEVPPSGVADGHLLGLVSSPSGELWLTLRVRGPDGSRIALVAASADLAPTSTRRIFLTEARKEKRKSQWGLQLGGEAVRELAVAGDYAWGCAPESIWRVPLRAETTATKR